MIDNKIKFAISRIDIKKKNCMLKMYFIRQLTGNVTSKHKINARIVFFIPKHINYIYNLVICQKNIFFRMEDWPSWI